MWRGLLLALLYSWLCSAITAQAQSIASTNVTAVDITAYPWSSIAKLNNSVGGSCTAAVIAQNVVLTAAHCIFNQRTNRFLSPSSLHVLLGYERGQYAVHALVRSYTIGPGYDPARKLATISSDWAVLALTEPLSSQIRPLKFVERTPALGARLMVASYARGRRHVLTADEDCQILREVLRPILLENDCRGAQGSSGAPLLISKGEVALIVGIQVAVAQNNKGSPRMLAVSALSIKLATAATTEPP